MLNGRRAAALESFDDFLKSTTEKPDLQMEVLKRVTEAIFSEQTTGYLAEKAANEKGTDSSAILKEAKTMVEIAAKNYRPR